MSKTTTMAQTRSARGGNSAEPAGAHHVISKGETRKPGGREKEKRYDDKKGHVLDERGKEENRRSSRSNSNKSTPAEVPSSKSKTNNQVDNRKAPSHQPVSVLKSQENQVPKQEKLPIKAYYEKNGGNYEIIRQNCRINVHEGALCLDSYQPPEGYTVEDLPDSQGQPQRIQECVKPLSPAVAIASIHKKPVPIVNTPPPCNDIIRRLQMRNSKGALSPLKASPILQSSSNLSSSPRVANETFPDDSLNDSDLVLASQQVESEYERNRLGAKDAIKRDINGNSKPQTPPVLLFTSTPVAEPCSRIPPVKETPRTARAVTRSRNRSNGQSTAGKGCNLNVELSLFETSGMDVSDGADMAPRKLLKFDESPIKRVRQIGEVLKVGEFDDDNEDDIFSQVEMPGEIREPSVAMFESSSESGRNGLGGFNSMDDDSSKSFGEMDCNETESFLNDDDLKALDKLEAVHCTSGGSTSSEKSLNQQKRNNRPVETPRAVTRFQGLSRGRKLAAN